MSDDSRTVNVLQSRSIQSMAVQHSEGVMRLCTGRHESLDVLCNREIISNNYKKWGLLATNEKCPCGKLLTMLHVVCNSSKTKLGVTEYVVAYEHSTKPEQ